MTLGVIGGTGLYKLDGIEIVKEHRVKTPFGDTTSPVFEADFNEKSCFFIARHGVNHSFTPSEVNYRANIFALKSLGVKHVISVSAVGSLKEELAPASIFLPDQFIDWTKGSRERTFFGNGIVGHVSTANPVLKSLQEKIYSVITSLDIPVAKDGSYLCIEGPQFSSRAESTIYRGFGASVIGMTNVPESYLAKEAGMAYATIAMVTDYDCWKEEHCTVEEIMKVVKLNTTNAQKILLKLLPELFENTPVYEPENTYAVITSEERQTKEQKELLKVLLC